MRSVKVKKHLLCSYKLSPPIYIETRAGSSHRADFLKIATPKCFKISRTSLNSTQHDFTSKCVRCQI